MHASRGQNGGIWFNPRHQYRHHQKDQTEVIATATYLLGRANLAEQTEQHALEVIEARFAEYGYRDDQPEFVGDKYRSSKACELNSAPSRCGSDRNEQPSGLSPHEDGSA